MTKKLSKRQAYRETLKLYTGTGNKGAGEMLIAQATVSIPEMNINGEDVRADSIAQNMLHGIAPQDQMEGMMAAQMIAMHNMAMDCSRRAMSEGQTFAGRDMNMRHATRLMNAFSNAVNALDKHRGKGQQKITVEHQHVQVEAGGQAIIGDVHHGGGDNDKTK